MVELNQENEMLRVTVTVALIAIIITLFIFTISSLKDNDYLESSSEKTALENKDEPKDLVSFILSPTNLLFLSLGFLFYESMLLLSYLLLTAFSLRYKKSKSRHASTDFLELLTRNNIREKLYDYAVGLSFYSILIPLYLIIFIFILVEPILTIMVIILSLIILIKIYRLRKKQ